MRKQVRCNEFLLLAHLGADLVENEIIAVKVEPRTFFNCPLIFSLIIAQDVSVII